MLRWQFASVTILQLIAIFSCGVNTPLQSSLPCVKRQNANARGTTLDELFCVNATLDLFRNFNIPLNKTYYLTCVNCSLPALDEQSFRVERNQVRTIHLYNCSVHLIRAFAFRHFPHLTGLLVRNNLLESVATQAFANLSRLVHLDLSRNSLQIVLNRQFADSPDIDLINLSSNRIFLVQPDAFAGLAHLRHLYLNNNAINNLDGGIFRHLPNLLLLQLDNNHIMRIESGTFARQTRLHALYLNNNTVQTLEPYTFKGCDQLADLQLLRNTIDSLGAGVFSGLYNLQSLTLSVNRIEDVHSYAFVGLEQLRTLDLSYNNIHKFDLDAVVGLHYLSLLWLNNNKLSDFSVRQDINSFDALYSIGLNDNNLSYFPYRLLMRRSPKLNHIFVQNNTWSCHFLANMATYMRDKNIKLCACTSCDKNITKEYIVEVCNFEQSQQNGDTNDLDFVTSNADTICLKICSVAFSTALIVFVIKVRC